MVLFKGRYTLHPYSKSRGCANLRLGFGVMWRKSCSLSNQKFTDTKDFPHCYFESGKSTCFRSITQDTEILYNSFKDIFYFKNSRNTIVLSQMQTSKFTLKHNVLIFFNMYFNSNVKKCILIFHRK